MDSRQRVRVVPSEGLDGLLWPLSNTSPRAEHHAAPLRRAIMRSRQWLLARQHDEGYWVGELEGDTILESEYILLLAYLGREDSPHARKAAQYIVEQQLPGGGWAMYPGGEVDISVSVKAYFALKLTGHQASADYMLKARQAILAHGGADAVNSFTRFYLALFGQISYEQCPAVPPEVVLLPRWFPVHLYAVSAWSRTIIVPLSIMSALRPVARIDSRSGMRELFVRRPEDWPELHCPGLHHSAGPLSWDRFFRAVDRSLKWLERHCLLPLRRRALVAAEKWMIDRFASSDGLGAIFPPMIWSIVALRCLGYADDGPELRYCFERLEGLVIEESDTLRLQPCKSPVWDTAITLRALSDSGVPPSQREMHRAADWLLDRQIRRRGDWAASVDAEPGGWCFEHANDFYPDLDDTAMALMALRDQFDSVAEPPHDLPPNLALLAHSSVDDLPTGRHHAAFLDRVSEAIVRGERWMLAMQNRDGGWGAFDRDNDRRFLCHVPFADHNAMIDPSTPDLTGRVLESLGRLGRRLGDPALERAVAYLRREQEPDGSWFGRWGVNYIYGTWQVITGLREVGVAVDDPAIVAGVNWLLAHQQPTGAWGESPKSYADAATKGQGPVTASQTAWAILGLIAAGEHAHSAVRRGIDYLVAAQRTDGSWEETQFTGTGFPRVFYLRYHMYPIYFPLMALAQFAVKTQARDQLHGPPTMPQQSLQPVA